MTASVAAHPHRRLSHPTDRLTRRYAAPRACSRCGRVLLAAVGLLAPAAIAQAPIGTGITYQGQLEASGSPANATYPMLFTLWDAETDGNQVGPTVTFDGAGGNPPEVDVVDGLFTVQLDFGAAAYNGDARWLEITVDGVPLTPRQQTTAAPFANFASAANTAYTANFATAPWTTISEGISYSEDGKNVGIGANAPSYRLSVNAAFMSQAALVASNATAGTWFDLFNGSQGGRYWRLSSSGSGNTEGAGKLLISDASQSALRLAIDGSGRVGIGNASPTARLEVSGGISAAGQTTAHHQGAHLEWNKAGGDGATWLLNQRGLGAGGIIFGEVDTADAVTERMRIGSNGFVGIGTAAPGNRLHVAGGNIQTDGALLFGAASQNSDAILFWRQNVSNDYSRLLLELGDNPGAGPNPGDEFLITAASQTQFIFRSNGDAYKTGFPGWGTISDARLKHDIEPLTGALDHMLQLKGRTYFYNDPTAPGAGPGKRTGFVAQEVEPYFPEWIGSLGDDTKTLQISGFEALTVEAMRELQDEKDAQIAALTERVEALEALVAKLAGQNPGADEK